MRKHPYRYVVIASSAIAIGALVAVPATAQTAQFGQPAPPESKPHVSVTPFMALGDDFAPGGGLSFTFPLTRRLSLEAEGSIGTDAMRSGASLLVDLVRIGRFTTYAAAGGGVQRDEVDHYLVVPDLDRIIGGYPDLRGIPLPGPRSQEDRVRDRHRRRRHGAARSEMELPCRFPLVQPEGRMARELAGLQRPQLSARRAALTQARKQTASATAQTCRGATTRLSM